MIYIANIRFPTEKAHGIQIAKTCEALLSIGEGVELWVPKRRTPITQAPKAYYGLLSELPVRRFFTLDLVPFGRFGFLAQALTFALSCALALRARKDIIYCRDEAVLWLLSHLTGAAFVWESHDGAWNLFARRAASACKALVVVTEGAKRLYISRGVPERKIYVIRNGIDLAAFSRAESKAAARARLGLASQANVAMYIGRLDGWKGTETLLDAAERLPEDASVVIIGGEPAQVERLRGAHPRVHFLGYRPYSELANNLAAADVLVLPNTAQSGISLDLTSPLKLMAYMAAGKPIVASDIPSVRELIDESSAYLVIPDDAEALSRGIRQALSASEAEVRATEARKRAASLDWSARAAQIRGILRTIHA